MMMMMMMMMMMIMTMTFLVTQKEQTLEPFIWAKRTSASCLSASNVPSQRPAPMVPNGSEKGRSIEKYPQLWSFETKKNDS